MEIEKRKMAAISAAISAYQKEEEGKKAAATESPTTSFQVLSNVWGLSGRQAIMHMRNLLQCRIFHK